MHGTEAAEELNCAETPAVPTRVGSHSRLQVVGIPPRGSPLSRLQQIIQQRVIVHHWRPSSS